MPTVRALGATRARRGLTAIAALTLASLAALSTTEWITATGPARQPRIVSMAFNRPLTGTSAAGDRTGSTPASANAAAPAAHASIPAKAKPVPAAVALNPALAVTQPGDSPATVTARARLKGVVASYQLANQDYDKASADAQAAAAALRAAQSSAAKAQTIYTREHTDLMQLLVAQYMSSSPVGTASAVLVSTSQDDVLVNIGLQQQMAKNMASQVSQAQDASARLDQARARVSAAADAATAALGRAQGARTVAASKLAQAQSLVATLHTSDVLAAANALQTGAGNPTEAATAMKAQTIATGAATEADYAAASNPAAVIAIAARAMLKQAAGLRPAPRVSGGVRFSIPTATGPVDEQAVMGPTQKFTGIGTYSGAVGQQASLALTPFDGVLSHSQWPSAGVGMQIPGTAPLLPANGTTVHPIIPAMPAAGPAGGSDPRRSVLRAEVAVTSALEQLGSPYVWDAAGPSTFDCSGLTLWAWGHAGVSLGHYTGTQILQGHQVAVNQLLPGDLLLFGANIHHVGMYLGAGFMIDAPDTGQYVKIERVTNDSDFAVAVRP